MRELNATDIGKADDLNKIIEKLDSVFLKDKNIRAYLAFKEFYAYNRSSGEM